MCHVYQRRDGPSIMHTTVCLREGEKGKGGMTDIPGTACKTINHVPMNLAVEIAVWMSLGKSAARAQAM